MQGVRSDESWYHLCWRGCSRHMNFDFFHSNGKSAPSQVIPLSQSLFLRWLVLLGVCFLWPWKKWILLAHLWLDSMWFGCSAVSWTYAGLGFWHVRAQIRKLNTHTHTHTHTYTHTHRDPGDAATRTSQALSCHRVLGLASPSAYNFYSYSWKPSFFLTFIFQPKYHLFREGFPNHPISNRSSQHLLPQHHSSATNSCYVFIYEPVLFFVSPSKPSKPK